MVLEGDHEACNFVKKENLAQVFFFKFCEIFTNTYFKEHLLTAASLLKIFTFTSK